MQALTYAPFERLAVSRPVPRIGYVASQCAGKDVLDLGCFDETALQKRDTAWWMHGQIAAVARSVLGIDNSAKLTAVGLETGPNSKIVRGSVIDLAPLVAQHTFDVVVAGELIEHLPNGLEFLKQLKRLFPGRELLITTPNATSIANVLLGASGRESNHPDHLQVYSYKTLNTLSIQAGFADWTIKSYFLDVPEWKLRVDRWRRTVVSALERGVNVFERTFPLLASGLILHVRRA